MARKRRQSIQRIVLTIALLIAAAAARTYLGGSDSEPNGRGADRVEAPVGMTIAAAAREHRSGVILQTSGRIKRTLTDDEEGSRHQRFILELPSGATVLVAHNIDLAQRVPVHRGDHVTIHGQYEWNERGGVLHWTHHDPGGRHQDGWIEHAGHRYQ